MGTVISLALKINDVSVVRKMMQELIAGYVPSDDIVDWVHLELAHEAEKSGSAT